jgi:hypothetical protein
LSCGTGSSTTWKQELENRTKKSDRQGESAPCHSFSPIYSGYTCFWENRVS